MSVEHYFDRPTNMACHNYCSINKAANGIRPLLGLGLNYCIQKSKPTNKTHATLARLRSDVRRNYFF